MRHLCGSNPPTRPRRTSDAVSGCTLALGRTPPHSPVREKPSRRRPMPLPTLPTKRAGSRLLAAAALLLSAVGVGAAAAAPAHALDYGSYNLAGVTGTGLHNTYDDKAEYTYLANALDTGTSLVELDTWANALNGKWDVSHGDPLASINNCVQASSSAAIYTGNRNQNLDSCLDDIRYWLLAHPTGHPIMVKIEMKNGFGSWSSQSPTAFDTYVQTHLSGVLY